MGAALGMWLRQVLPAEYLVPVVVTLLAVAVVTLLLAWPRKHRCAGIPIKLRHQTDAERFRVGKLLTIDDPVELAALGFPVSSPVCGTFEGELVVTEVDHAAGAVTVRAR